jgi:hypothetical protein
MRDGLLPTGNLPLSIGQARALFKEMLTACDEHTSEQLRYTPGLTNKTGGKEGFSTDGKVVLS